MKLRKIIIITMIILIVISVNSQCFAKYVFQYTNKAAEITIKNN